MIHIAMVILAVYVLWKAGTFALALVLEGFDRSPGSGCLILTGVLFLIVALICLT